MKPDALKCVNQNADAVISSRTNQDSQIDYENYR